MQTLDFVHITLYEAIYKKIKAAIISHMITVIEIQII